MGCAPSSFEAKDKSHSNDPIDPKKEMSNASPTAEKPKEHPMEARREIEEGAPPPKHQTQSLAKTNTKLSRMLICYSCGQKYGPTSLPIHLKSCPEKRKNNMKDIPASVRPKAPPPPQLAIPSDSTMDPLEILHYNEEAEQIYRKFMCVCPNEKCRRTFDSGPFLVHLRSCKDEDGRTFIEKQAATKIQSQWRGYQQRKMIVCYCCGQEYGSASLPIHLKDCPTKREIYWRVLPEELQKPIPEAPSLPLPTSESTAKDILEWNKQAYEIYKQSMAQCPGCSSI